ncbi:hypothetical protein ABL78_6114 [Leptomonas seymouri]|uniref:GST C-terminal domain-containing protein n=1 Tax=Leptomonas seymouri TaxID=5684 RepID=A0A0N1I3U3_LEPSE|nr:hypothetical protein ABL78_6114 [Leptomonas seymouri]|eukprot:KPI84830.1 hypothetical protein ABL78_6114 [Leptomonas seymouri]
MKGKAASSPFRVFGSPYTLLLHQHVTYLRLKQLPFKVYCTNFSTTFLYSLYYRARNCFCTLTPNGTSRVQVWQLAETTELDEDLESIANSAKGEVRYKTAASGDTAKDRGAAVSRMPTTRTQRLLISKETHPNLHLASWCVVVYSCWWLAKTGAMYRYVRGESLDVLEGYVRFFFIVGGIGFARLMAPRFRQLMKQVVRATGASEQTAPYMDEHFMRFCAALEAHLRDHPGECFLLGTPHPTLADVTLGAAFSSFFLMDDPPSTTLAEKFPYVAEYAERVTGWQGSTFVGATDEATSADAGATEGEVQVDGATRSSGVDNGEELRKEDLLSKGTQKASAKDYIDVVPESLAPCFELMTEVFPFLMSQCASFTAFMAGDGVRTLKREPLEGEWKGCEGYLLPQLANIKSLMIVDNDVSTVLTRSQDLEIAFLASREVNDDALRNFGRHDDSAKPPLESPTSTLHTAEERDQTAAGTARTRADAAAALECESAMTTAKSPTRSEAAARGEKVDGDAVTPPFPAPRFVQPMDLDTVDPAEADFYRAYSTAGRRRLGGDATSLAGAMPTARHATTTACSAVVSRSSVMTRLETLRTMLAKMSCPQYTLTTVFHGRRIYVAVIPEYEVAKVRKARQETAARATAKAAAQLERKT